MLFISNHFSTLTLFFPRPPASCRPAPSANAPPPDLRASADGTPPAVTFPTHAAHLEPAADVDFPRVNLPAQPAHLLVFVPISLKCSRSQSDASRYPGPAGLEEPFTGGYIIIIQQYASQLMLEPLNKNITYIHNIQIPSRL